MKDFADISNTTGSFPDVVANNDTVPGDKTGTPLLKQWVDEMFGFYQALLDNASLTPSGSAELHDSSQLLTALQTTFIDAKSGGTYSPSASLTWNQALIVDASAGGGTNVTAITATAKGSGDGGVFYGGSNAGDGVTAQGGGGTSSAGDGLKATGGNATAGPGANGVEGYGGDGTTYGGIGVYGYGGTGTTDDGPGGYLRGKGGASGLTLAGQGAIIAGGDASSDALWAITNTGSAPGSAKNDYAIYACSGGAFGTAAIYAVNNLGYGLVSVTNSGIACALTSTTTGSPLYIAPRSGTPSTNVLEGCIYVDDDDGVEGWNCSVWIYTNAGWKQLAFN